MALDADGWELQYKISDHLGNTAALFKEEMDNGVGTRQPEVLQRYMYYPFGMEMDGAWNFNPLPDNENPKFDFRYNGKELDQAFGLDWYAYGARFYDPAVGRFTGVDPLAFLAPNLTPFRYAFNNPISFIDPYGLFETRAEARAYRKEHGLKDRISKSDEKSNQLFTIHERGTDVEHFKINGNVLESNLPSANVKPGTFFSLGRFGDFRFKKNGGGIKGGISIGVGNEVDTGMFGYKASSKTPIIEITKGLDYETQTYFILDAIRKGKFKHSNTLSLETPYGDFKGGTEHLNGELIDYYYGAGIPGFEAKYNKSKGFNFGVQEDAAFSLPILPQAALSIFFNLDLSINYGIYPISY